jgi:hypothetical protein
MSVFTDKFNVEWPDKFKVTFTLTDGRELEFSNIPQSDMEPLRDRIAMGNGTLNFSDGLVLAVPHVIGYRAERMSVWNEDQL